MKAFLCGRCGERLGSSHFYYYQMLTSLAKHYKFDIETPYEDFASKIKDIVMHGSGKEEIEFQYMNDRGDVVIRKHPFEGISNNMARRYKETESMSVREELAKISATALACRLWWFTSSP